MKHLNKQQEDICNRAIAQIDALAIVFAIAVISLFTWAAFGTHFN